MKRRIAKISITVIIVVLIVIYYYPKPLAEVIASDGDITITRIDVSVENGLTKQKVTTYRLLPETDSYGRAKDIFSNYTYHINLHSLFKTNGLDIFKDNVYSINFNNDFMKNMEFDGSGEIIINNHSYSMRVSEQKALMDEIESLLATETSVFHS